MLRNTRKTTASHIKTKPVYAINEQRCRWACASLQSDQYYCYSLPTWYNTSSCYIHNSKALTSFYNREDRFEPQHDKINNVAVFSAKTQISLGIRPVWSYSSLCTQWVAKDQRFHHADSEDWSDWADAQADLSLCWAHTHFVGFVMSRLICVLVGSHNSKDSFSHGNSYLSPVTWKPVFGGLRPCKTQTGLLSYRD